MNSEVFFCLYRLYILYILVQFAEDEGMQLCKCINGDTCNFEENGLTYFNESINNGQDFNRETVPFIGRW